VVFWGVVVGGGGGGGGVGGGGGGGGGWFGFVVFLWVCGGGVFGVWGGEDFRKTLLLLSGSTAEPMGPVGFHFWKGFRSTTKVDRRKKWEEALEKQSLF